MIFCCNRFDRTVEPEIVGFDILVPFHLSFYGHIIVFAEFVFGLDWLAVFLFAGLGPIPGHFGRIDPCHGRYVATLTGDFIRVVVCFGAALVRCGAVA